MQARQLESLIRMAEARARLELVQVVTAQHAQVSHDPHMCLVVCLHSNVLTSQHVPYLGLAAV